MPRLIVSEPGFDVREFEVDGIVTIGRSSDNAVRLREERASRHHARILASGDQYIIEDLKSSNGTTVNGLRVQRKALRHGDEIAIGKVRILFRDEKAGDLIGAVLGGYRILSKIGQGGMGAVYRAHQISMDRTVALKVLKKELTQNREFVRGFLQEARVAGHLNHPAIIQVHDFGEDKGTYYFSMEFVEGETVQAILDREGKLPVEKAVEIAISVAEALCHARMHQVVHQDIKPQNIMIDRSGNVKLADLGLAVVGGRQRPEQKAGPSVIMGTPHYMAPEQGKREKIDSRTDIYSLGCTLFHMVTGRVPFDGPNSLAVITKHIIHERPNPRQYDITLPESLCNLIRWMMAIDPKDRPQTPEVVLDALKKVKTELEQKEKARAKAASQASSGMVRRRAPIPPRPRTAGQTPVAAGGGLLVLGTAFFVLLAIVVVGVMMLMRESGERDGRGRGDGGRDDGTSPAKKEPAPDNRQAPAAKTEPPAKRGTSTVPEKIETPRSGSPAQPETDPAKVAADETAARALEAAMEAHRRAIASGDFLRARSVLRRFAEDRAGTAKAAEAAAALRELDEAVEAAFKRIAEMAERHIASKNYPAAAVECGKLLNYDPRGKWSKRAGELLDACDAGAEPIFRRMSADADAAMKGGNLQDAIDTIDSCLDRVAGTKWADAASSRQVQLLLARQFVEKLAKAFADRPPSAPKVTLKIEHGGSYYNSVLTGIPGMAVELSVSGPPAVRIRKGLLEMPFHELHDLAAALRCDGDLLGIGCILLLAGNRTKAEDILGRAAAMDGPQQQVAAGILASISGARNVISCDFSKVADMLDWQAESGSWTITGGQYILETEDGGDTKLAKEIPARNARISFEFEPKKTPMTFCAELTAGDSRSLAVVFGSDLATLSSNLAGQSSHAVPFSLSPGRVVRVLLQVDGDDARLMLNGETAVSLPIPGLSKHKWGLAFRIRGAACAIDNVRMFNAD